MVEAGTFTTNAEVLRKAGAQASSTSSAEAYTNQYILEAESYINVLTRTNYTDSYSTLNDDVKKLLSEAASNLAAIYVISYDQSSFSSTRIAENTMTFLWARFIQCIKLLSDSQSTKFIESQTA